MSKSSKVKGFAPKVGKKKSKGRSLVAKPRSDAQRIEREMAEAQAEWMAEEAQERKQRIKGMSREELMRSPEWVYEMANEETVKGTLNEMLEFLSERNDPIKFNVEKLRQKALSDGGIDVEVGGLYETIEFEGGEVLIVSDRDKAK